MIQLIKTLLRGLLLCLALLIILEITGNEPAEVPETTDLSYLPKTTGRVTIDDAKSKAYKNYYSFWFLWIFFFLTYDTCCSVP